MIASIIGIQNQNSLIFKSVKLTILSQVAKLIPCIFSSCRVLQRFYECSEQILLKKKVHKKLRNDLVEPQGRRAGPCCYQNICCIEMVFQKFSNGFADKNKFS